MAAEVDPALEHCVGLHPLFSAVADMRVVLGAATDSGLWSLTDDQVVAAVGEVLALRSCAEALTASLVAQAESRAVRQRLGQVTTTGWLRRRFLLPLTEARRLTDLTAALPKWSRVRAALAEAPLGVQAAAVITTVLSGLPETTSAAELVRAEELLVTQGAFLDPSELAQCGRP